MPSDDAVELPDCQVLARIAHPVQRNRTWLVRYRGVDAVAKRYRLLSTDAVAELCAIESRLRSAGVAVPELLHRSADEPVAVHARVLGRHVSALAPAMIADCARMFATQLLVLRGVRASWAPPRPHSPPRRGRVASEKATDTGTVRLIVDSWQALAAMSGSGVAATSHADWRADNILFDGERMVAILDWEDLITLPAAEAIGYAAASLTHSWRAEIYAPVTLEPIEFFLSFAQENGVLRAEAWTHARTAALYTAAVRLAEDQERGAAVISGRELRRALGAGL